MRALAVVAAIALALCIGSVVATEVEADASEVASTNAVEWAQAEYADAHFEEEADTELEAEEEEEEETDSTEAEGEAEAEAETETESEDESEEEESAESEDAVFLQVDEAEAADTTHESVAQAVERVHSEQQSKQVSKVKTGVKGDDEFSECKTCVFVLERIKKGTNMLLPAICSELYLKYPDSYAFCHQVLNALSLNGNNVRYWLFEGCYKYEIYQAKEWNKPCPSHVMCSVLKNLSNAPFCTPMPMEDPFAED